MPGAWARWHGSGRQWSPARCPRRRSGFRSPSLEVGAEDRHFLVVSELAAAEAFGPAADPQFPGSGGPQVAHPLSLATGRDQVAAAVVTEQVHRRSPPLAARPAPHGQHPRAEDADAPPGQGRHQPVEDVAREPARRAVVIGHAAQPSRSGENNVAGLSATMAGGAGRTARAPDRSRRPGDSAGRAGARRCIPPGRGSWHRPSGRTRPGQRAVPLRGRRDRRPLPGQAERQPVVPGHQAGGPAGQGVLGRLEARRRGCARARECAVSLSRIAAPTSRHRMRPPEGSGWFQAAGQGSWPRIQSIDSGQVGAALAERVGQVVRDYPTAPRGHSRAPMTTLTTQPSATSSTRTTPTSPAHRDDEIEQDRDQNGERGLPGLERSRGSEQ